MFIVSRFYILLGVYRRMVLNLGLGSAVNLEVVAGNMSTLSRIRCRTTSDLGALLTNGLCKFGTGYPSEKRGIPEPVGRKNSARDPTSRGILSKILYAGFINLKNGWVLSPHLGLKPGLQPPCRGVRAK